MSAGFTNMAWYRFVEIEDPRSLRIPLLERCEALSLKGTILLSHEGINVNIAGSEHHVNSFRDTLESDSRFQQIDAKYSFSAHQPYTRMMVKLRRGIIPTRDSPFNPPGPKISTEELEAWYQSGEEFTMLDTRNDYEVRLGRFEGAIDLGLAHFIEFSETLASLDDELKHKPLVMYCTGGIRCEKASMMMLDAGFEQVYQLDGGILRYLELSNGTYWNGECFVFDKRVALDEELKETDTVQCFICREPVDITEQQSEAYIIGKRCPRCPSYHLNRSATESTITSGT